MAETSYAFYVIGVEEKLLISSVNAIMIYPVKHEMRWKDCSV